MFKFFLSQIKIKRKDVNIIFWLNFLFLGINLFWQNNFLINIILFTIFFVFAGYYASLYANRLLQLDKFRSLVFGYLILIYLLSFAVALFVNFYKYHILFAYVSILIVGVVIFFVSKNLDWLPVTSKDDTSRDITVRSPFYLTYLLPLFLIGGILLLLSARTGDYLITPWQVIPKIYVYIFLLVTFTVGILIFSKLKTGFIILLIILHSYFLHTYLPIIYETGFGGDKWRHLASEKFLKTGQVYTPSLIGEPLRLMTLGPWQVPEVLFAGNKTSYGNQWGLTLLLSDFLAIDIFWIDYWLIFILWSFFIPLLLYQLAGFVYQSTKFKLLIAWLPTIFYTWQVFGAVTLPVSLGMIFFLAVLYLWLYYLQTNSKKVRNLAIIFTFLMYFGYVLYFIIMSVLAVGFLIWGEIKNNTWRRALLTLIIFLACLVIPAMEILMGYGSLKSGITNPAKIFSLTADAFGNLTGIVAFIPRPTHIDQGNWLYNQTRQTQSQASLFSLRLLPLIFTSLVWLLTLLGIQKIRKLPEKKFALFILLSFVVLLFTYIFSWYFMDGNHILARRLDLTITFFWLFLIGLGIFYLLEYFLPKTDNFIKVYSLIIFISLLATSTYSSGPVLEVVTKDEVIAAQYIWERIDKKNNYCVVANTWPLLGLEYVSGREIIAGGFPVYLEYAQPERVKIFEGLIRKPLAEDWMAKAFEVTQANECWYMTEKRWMSDKVWEDNLRIFGEPKMQIGQVYIWQIKRD